MTFRPLGIGIQDLTPYLKHPLQQNLQSEKKTTCPAEPAYALPLQTV